MKASDSSSTMTLHGYTFYNPPLGKGSYGTVYRVVYRDPNNPKMQTEYAAKSISKKLINERNLNELLRNETTIHKKLKHKNIVSYITQFSTVSDIYIVLERCNSETLENIVLNYHKIFDKPLSIKLIQHFITQLCNAVHYMHTKGIAHRDLKLDNIMLKFDPEDVAEIDSSNSTGYFYYNQEYTSSQEKFEELMLKATLKVIDLGFAKEQENFISFLGTPAYLAPEIVKKKTKGNNPMTIYSSKVDTWSLGVITFQTVTGRLPIELTDKIKNFEDLYGLHKDGIVKISSSLVLTTELMDFLNALLQFDEEERINIDDLVEHPFIKTPSEDQKLLFVKDLIKDGGSFLKLSTLKRLNYLNTGRSFGYLRGDRTMTIDKTLYENDSLIDELFEVNTKITLFEREEDGFIVITKKEVEL